MNAVRAASRASAEQAERASKDPKLSAEEQAAQAKEAGEVAKRKVEQEIDDMLADLKRNLKSGSS